MSILFIDACIRPVSRTMTLCRAARMTYIYTAGGRIPRDNSAVAELNVRIEVKVLAEIGTVTFHENPLYQEHRLIIPSYTNGGKPSFSPALDWTYKGYAVAPECEYLASWSAASGSAFYTEYLDFAGVDAEGMFLAPTSIKDRLQEGGSGSRRALLLPTGRARCLAWIGG